MGFRKLKVVILTGAGISAESGIPTFRDSNGLWENHNVEDVATPKAWMENPEMVWRFYQERRRNMSEVEPNHAHNILVRLEKELTENDHDFTLITQNIDGLHLKAGSQNIVEMHGALRRIICQRCKYFIEGYDYLDDDFLPCEKCGEIMRPDVVWFEEMPKEPEKYETAVDDCNIFASIGTSSSVYPAAGFLRRVLLRRDSSVVYHCNLDETNIPKSFGVIEYIGNATAMVPILVNDIIGRIRKK